MKDYLKRNWFSLSLLGAVLCFGLGVYSRLPNQVPSHWDWSGRPDRFSSKTYFLFFLPALNAVLMFLMPTLVRLSPEDFQMEHSQKSLIRVNFSITVLLSGIYLGTLLNLLDPGRFPIGVSFGISISMFMILFGDYMGKVERNFFIGIRTPWTIVSENNWRATHRIGAKIMVTSGFLSAALTLLWPGHLYASILLIAALVAPVFYSFWFYWENERWPTSR